MSPLLFSDQAFLFFFAPIVLTAYWMVPARWRNGLLLTASLMLYAWAEGRYGAVLLASIGINWSAGAAIARSAGTKGRKWLLFAGVALNLSLLGVFKYATFVILNLDVLLAGLGFVRIEPPALRLPIGLSFYTFMGISYLVDLYRRDVAAPSSPVRVALYLSMFPHLIAGPIVRMTEIGSQFAHLRFANAGGIAGGIRRFVIGLGKKMLIANTLASASDAVFQLPPHQITTPLAWSALLCYTLEIYFDFSGYSDMAIGLARMLGFEFPENFNYPYISQSIGEFWRRWHMTLSSWLRDYLFFPLGVRGGRLRVFRNLLIVFFLCGLWHGASYNFIAWGLWHGMLLGMEQLGFAKVLQRVPAPFRSAYTLAAVSAGWILFRSSSLHYAFGFGKVLLGSGGRLPPDWIAPLVENPSVFIALAAGIVAAIPWNPVLSRLAARFGPGPRLASLAGYAEFAALGCVFLSALAAGAGETYNPFIYFRF